MALGCTCIHRLEQIPEVPKCINPLEERWSSVSSASDDSSVALDSHATLIDIPLPEPPSEDIDNSYNAGISDFSQAGADTGAVDKTKCSGRYVGKYVIPAQRKPGQPGFKAKSKNVCKDHELKPSEPKSSLQNQNGKYLILQIVKVQRSTKRTYSQPNEQLFPET